MNEFYIDRGELYHHGILGQKWGKQNGPPYPLDESDHSSSERKAGWKKSIAKGAKAVKKRAKATVVATGQKAKAIAKDAQVKGRQKVSEMRAKSKQKKLDKAQKRLTKKEVKKNEDVRTLSDDELRERIARLRMEQDYANLMRNRGNGESYAKTLLKNSGKQFIEKAARDLTNKAAEDFVKKMSGNKDLDLSSMKKAIDAMETKNRYEKLKKGETKFDKLKQQVQELQFEATLERLKKEQAERKNKISR